MMERKRIGDQVHGAETGAAKRRDLVKPERLAAKLVQPGVKRSQGDAHGEHQIGQSGRSRTGQEPRNGQGGLVFGGLLDGKHGSGPCMNLVTVS